MSTTIPPATERFTALISSRNQNGELRLVVEPVCEASLSGCPPRRFTVSVWREGFKTIRMRLRAEGSGTTAYLQGGLPLLALAAELGLVGPRKRSERYELAHRGRA